MESATIIGLTGLVFTLIQYIFKLKIEKNIDLKITKQTAIFKENLSTKNQHYINLKSLEREAYIDFNKKLFSYIVSTTKINEKTLMRITNDELIEYRHESRKNETEMVSAYGHLRLFIDDKILREKFDKIYFLVREIFFYADRYSTSIIPENNLIERKRHLLKSANASEKNRIEGEIQFLQTYIQMCLSQYSEKCSKPYKEIFQIQFEIIDFIREEIKKIELEKETN